MQPTTGEDPMATAQDSRDLARPWHLWVVGGVGGVWSVVGLVSFMLTQLNVEAAMSGFPPEQRAYFTSFPWWADACWALGVAGGVIGCLLLLRRDRRAAPILLAALVGTTVSSLGGLFLLDGMAVMRATDGLGLTVLPVVIAAALALYARAMRQAPSR